MNYIRGELSDHYPERFVISLGCLPDLEDRADPIISAADGISRRI